MSGNYFGGVTKGQAGAVPGTSDTSAKFDGVNGGVSSADTVTNPRVYSEELWFKTNTDQGGKLIGFGTKQSNETSDGYDRHVYMETRRPLTFGTWTGQTNTITSPDSYNDGSWHHMVARQDGERHGAVRRRPVGWAPTRRQTPRTTRASGVSVATTTWGGTDPWFDGTIDEVAVYSKSLSASDIASHYALGSGVTPANQDPNAAFTKSANGQDVSFDATTSSDPDGDTLTYAWDYGDGGSATGVTPTAHHFSTGSHTVTLTVSDGKGGTDTATDTFTVTAANQDPNAAFTKSANGQDVSFDATTSSDPDGDTLTYAWDYGDGGSATGVTPTAHHFSTGSHTVTLTVSDGKGGTDTATDTFTVAAANQDPNAAFTRSMNGQAASFDATTSSDPDGDSLSYAWSYDDGGSDTGVKPAPHTFSAGSHSVTLTVSDGKGGTDTATDTFTVTAPAGATLIGSDDFGRNVTNGWGTADKGGAWTVTGTKSQYKVGSGVGTTTMSKAGAGPTLSLANVSTANSDLQMVVSPQALATGAGTYTTVYSRVVGTASYRAKLVFKSNGAMTIGINKVVGATTTMLVTAKNVSGVSYAAGDQLNMRVQTVGTSPTTIRAKVWKVGTTEPTAWLVSTTDSTAGLQSAGSIGLQSYLSGSSTNAPAAVSYDALRLYDTGQ